MAIAVRSKQDDAEDGISKFYCYANPSVNTVFSSRNEYCQQVEMRSLIFAKKLFHLTVQLYNILP